MFKKNKKKEDTEDQKQSTVTPEEVKSVVDRLSKLQKRPQYIIPILNCIPNEYNLNRMNQERMDALKDFILLKGQVGDIVVRPISVAQYDFNSTPTLNDKFIIVDGYHRWKVLQALNMKTIAIKIIDYTEREARISTLGFNKIHGATSQIDERRIMDGYWDSGSKDIEGILMMDYIDLVTPEPEVDTSADFEPLDIDAPVSPNLGVETSNQDTKTNNETDNINENNQNTQTNNTSNNTQQNGNAEVAGPVRPATQSRPEETFALPYFFKSSDYQYITDTCMKIRTKFKVEGMADAFVLAFRDGERVMSLTEENNRLVKKLERMELADQERKDNAAKRKEEKMIKELAREKEKQKKQEKKLADKNLQ